MRRTALDQIGRRADAYKVGFDDLYQVGVLARILAHHPHGTRWSPSHPQYGKKDCVWLNALLKAKDLTSQS